MMSVFNRYETIRRPAAALLSLIFWAIALTPLFSWIPNTTMVYVGSTGLGALIPALLFIVRRDGEKTPPLAVVGMIAAFGTVLTVVFVPSLPAVMASAGAMTGVVLTLLFLSRRAGDDAFRSVLWLLALPAVDTPLVLPFALIATLPAVQDLSTRLVPLRWKPSAEVAVIRVLLSLPAATALLLWYGGFSSIVEILSWIGVFALLLRGGIEWAGRLGALGSMVPRGKRRGIAASWAVYYLVPFRRRRLREFYRPLISPGRLVVDVGSHLGNRVRVFLDLGAQVVAVEPQRACAALLENWFGGDPRFSLLSAVAGTRNGSIRLRTPPKHPTLASVNDRWIEDLETHARFQGIQWTDEIVVESIRLADIVRKHGAPGFVKIDVEGGEKEVLDGVDAPLEFVSFEVLPASRNVAMDCVDRIRSWGDYRFNLVLGEEGRFVDPRWVDGESMKHRLQGMDESGPSGDVYARVSSAFERKDRR